MRGVTHRFVRFVSVAAYRGRCRLRNLLERRPFFRGAGVGGQSPGMGPETLHRKSRYLLSAPILRGCPVYRSKRLSYAVSGSGLAAMAQSSSGRGSAGCIKTFSCQKKTVDRRAASTRNHRWSRAPRLSSAPSEKPRKSSPSSGAENGGRTLDRLNARMLCRKHGDDLSGISPDAGHGRKQFAVAHGHDGLGVVPEGGPSVSARQKSGEVQAASALGLLD
jgi:hypothetical protein